MYECCHAHSPPPAWVVIVQATYSAGVHAAFGLSVAMESPCQDCASHDRRVAMTCLYCMLSGDDELCYVGHPIPAYLREVCVAHSCIPSGFAASSGWGCS
jgi:hypothetical protein